MYTRDDDSTRIYPLLPPLSFFDGMPSTFRLNNLYVLLPKGRMYVLLRSEGDGLGVGRARGLGVGRDARSGSVAGVWNVSSAPSAPSPPSASGPRTSDDRSTLVRRAGVFRR